MSNVLDPSSVLHTLAQILPKENADESKPQTLLRSNYDGIAAVSHAIMVSVGFRLVGIGEDDHKGENCCKTQDHCSWRDVLFNLVEKSPCTPLYTPTWFNNAINQLWSNSLDIDLRCI